MKIAIIEDEQSISEMYEFKLKQAGYDVKVAADGVEGLKLVESFNPDIVLLDLKMPNMTGEEMLTKMRHTEWGKNTKVIVLTNVSSDNASAELQKLGVTDYIVKANLTPHQVVDKIKKIFD